MGGPLPIGSASALDATTACTITTDDNTDTLSLISTDADANAGPNLRFYRNSSSPADDDVIGRVDFEGRNNNSEDIIYANIQGEIMQEADGSEDGQLQFGVMKAGTLRNAFTIDRVATVFNEDSQDIDFRVESDGSTHQLFVDAGNGRVGIGTSSPDYTLHVRSTGSPSNDTFIDIEGNATDANCGIQFTDSAGNLQGRLSYDTDDDNLQFNVNAAERMRINSSGYVGINNTNPSATLEVHTNNNITAFETQPKVNQTYYAALFRNSSGNDVGQIESTASATTFATSSDYRLKENVDYTWDATTRLKQLKPARFNWIIDDTNTLVDGFLAHEVSSIVPEAISGEKDGTETRTKVVLDASGNQLARNVEEADWVKGKEDKTFPSDSTWEASKVYPKHQAIDHSKLVPLMVKTIQELEARIKALEDA
tara:strand:- start:3 stop:1277 length:1275 start_codon:yes stop_codon:yes gene_type:complete